MQHALASAPGPAAHSLSAAARLQVGNVINVHRPRETLNHKLPRLEERTTLIYSSARCADEAYFNNGLNFRYPPIRRVLLMNQAPGAVLT